MLTSKVFYKLLDKKRHKRRKLRKLYRLGGANTANEEGADERPSALDYEVTAISEQTEDALSRNEEVLKKKEEKDAVTIQRLDRLGQSKSAMKAGMYAFIITAAIQGANVVLTGTEIAADIGSALPIIGVGLVLIQKLIKQGKAFIELKDILEDIQISLASCDNLIKLIIKTMKTFQGYRTIHMETIANQLTKKIEDTKDQDRKQELMKILNGKIKSFITARINPEIEIRLQAKIKVINIILEEIDAGFIKQKSNEQVTDTGNKSSMYSRLNSAVSGINSAVSGIKTMVKKSSKFFLANDYQKKIHSALNVINNLLIVYNSQFDWVVRVNERLLQNVTIPVISIPYTNKLIDSTNEAINAKTEEEKAKIAKKEKITEKDKENFNAIKKDKVKSDLKTEIDIIKNLSNPTMNGDESNQSEQSNSDLDNKQNQEFILEAIWNVIEQSEEFKYYLLNEVDKPTDPKAGGKKTYRKKLHTKSRNITRSKNKRHNSPDINVWP
jgi:hypothetical protein